MRSLFLCATKKPRPPKRVGCQSESRVCLASQAGARSSSNDLDMVQRTAAAGVCADLGWHLCRRRRRYCAYWSCCHRRGDCHHRE